MRREPSASEKRKSQKQKTNLFSVFPGMTTGMTTGDQIAAPAPQPSSTQSPPPASGSERRVFYARDYQTDCADRVFEEWQDNHSTLVVMATGLGKTIVSTLVCQRALAGELKKSGGFLFLAHREELIDQALETFRAAFPDKLVEVEKATQYASRRADIVIGSVQSISKDARMRAFAPDRFAAVCVDESKHCVGGNVSYKSLCDYFTGKILGLEATPDRADEQALGEIFDSVAFRYDIVDGIREGWLVPVGQRLERCVGIDFSKVSLDKDGEFNEKEIAEVMREKRALFTLSEAAIKYSNWQGGKRASLVFAASREHACEIADILNVRHTKEGTGRAAAVHYKLDPLTRREVIAEYKRGNIRYLTNYGILGEGFDDDRTCVIVNGRPFRKNRAGFVQIVGRATRPLKSLQEALSQASGAGARRELIRTSAKPGAICVDTAGINHKLILTMTDILGGKSSEEVMQLVRERVANSDKPVDVEAEIEKAQRELERREEAARKARLYQAVDVRVTINGQKVDPFNPMKSVSARDLGIHIPSGRPITPGQRGLLLKFGFDAAELSAMGTKQASSLIDTCLQRRRMGFCTYKMAKILRQYGYDGNVSFEDAKTTLDQLKANGWKKRES